MTKAAEKTETGHQWWLRYVVIPLVVALIGSAGLFAYLKSGKPEEPQKPATLSSSNQNTVPAPTVPVPPPPPTHPPKQKVFLVDSPTRRGVLEFMHKRLEHSDSFEVVDHPPYVDWLVQCPELASEHPALIIVHWHTLRSDFGSVTPSDERDRRAADKLLQGLRLIPDAKIILYSSAFAMQPESDSRRAVVQAAERLSKQAPELKESYDALASHVQLLPWPDAPTDADTERLRALVARLLKP
jgi:hypothetical protein